MNRHSNRKQSTAWAALVTAVALCVALAPAAQAQEIAQVRPGSSGIDFLPVVENGGFVLTVSGPEGFHHRAEFGPGESPSFSIFDEAGGAVADGVYNWELTVIPSETQRREAFEANRIETRSGGVEPRIQSGAFSIVGGAVIAGGETEPGQEPAGSGPVLATKDFVINDDLIVTRSACIGFDCVNGETFGFDTIRMKENNTRIKFEDTSVGSFPTVDWELQANDSANGGQSWFRVNDVDNGTSPFTVEADTPSHTLYVDSAKRIGIGTSTPVVQLHIKDGNSPALRLEQDTSAGFAAQTWDVAGNEANFFVRSATTGSQLPFRIRPGAPTSSIDIAASGNVGIGTTAPSGNLHVKGGSDEVLFAGSAGTGVGTSSPSQDLEVTDRGDANDNTAIRVSTASHAWDFSTNENTGNFRISKLGTGTSEFDLTAAGDLTISGDIFTSSCSPCTSDYVFEPGYELMPLGELAAFIRENKHLPNVPSEADYQEQGRIGLHSHQLKLLEKIEELTLYTLSLHETVEELEADRDAKNEALAAVEERLAELTAREGVE